MCLRAQLLSTLCMCSSPGTPVLYLPDICSRSSGPRPQAESSPRQGCHSTRTGPLAKVQPSFSGYHISMHHEVLGPLKNESPRLARGHMHAPCTARSHDAWFSCCRCWRPAASPGPGHLPLASAGEERSLFQNAPSSLPTGSWPRRDPKPHFFTFTEMLSNSGSFPW